MAMALERADALRSRKARGAIPASTSVPVIHQAPKRPLAGRERLITVAQASNYSTRQRKGMSGVRFPGSRSGPFSPQVESSPALALLAGCTLSDGNRERASREQYPPTPSPLSPPATTPRGMVIARTAFSSEPASSRPNHNRVNAAPTTDPTRPLVASHFAALQSERRSVIRVDANRPATNADGTTIGSDTRAPAVRALRRRMENPLLVSTDVPPPLTAANEETRLPIATTMTLEIANTRRFDKSWCLSGCLALPPSLASTRSPRRPAANPRACRPHKRSESRRERIKVTKRRTGHRHRPSSILPGRGGRTERQILQECRR